jgi:hypothetical protein
MDYLPNLIIAGLSIATIFGLLGMGVNAIRLLKSFRNGILAKGWKFISIAAFFLIYGIVALDLSISSWLPSGNIHRVFGLFRSCVQGDRRPRVCLRLQGPVRCVESQGTEERTNGNKNGVISRQLRLLKVVPAPN